MGMRKTRPKLQNGDAEEIMKDTKIPVLIWITRQARSKARSGSAIKYATHNNASQKSRLNKLFCKSMRYILRLLFSSKLRDMSCLSVPTQTMAEVRSAMAQYDQNPRKLRDLRIGQKVQTEQMKPRWNMMIRLKLGKTKQDFVQRR